MRILGLDTATRATTVALWSADGPALEARDDPPASERPRHTTRLMALIAQLLEQSQLSWGDLDRIAVGVGPGTFTGLRIGIATARGLAAARGLGLVAVSSLESLALGAAGETQSGHDAVLALIDARRGEVFAAAWSRENVPLLAPCAIAPDALADRLATLAAHPLAVGDGAIEFRGVLERFGALVPEDRSDLHKVSAVNHCRLAARRPDGRPDQILPDYLRLPDAEIARRSARSQ